MESRLLCSDLLEAVTVVWIAVLLYGGHPRSILCFAGGMEVRVLLSTLLPGGCQTGYISLCMADLLSSADGGWLPVTLHGPLYRFAL